MRVIALLAVVSVLAGTSSAANRPTPRRQLTFARLESTHTGIAVVDDITTCGTSCTSDEPHVFLTGDSLSWREITPPHMLFQFEDAVFLDSNRGWVVANDCAAGRAFVYRTSDGGRSWRSAAVDGINCAAGSRMNVTFADMKRGWLLGVDANGNPPYRFARTVDGGATWAGMRSAPVAGGDQRRGGRESVAGAQPVRRAATAVRHRERRTCVAAARPSAPGRMERRPRLSGHAHLLR